MAASAHDLIQTFALVPHPEGGHYRRIHASTVEVEVNGCRRPAMTAIHYLLAAGQRSRWHRVDGDECWQWQQGSALELLRYDQASGHFSRTLVGPGREANGAACIVPAGCWQSARVHEDYALVTCTVAPGFVWEGFELLDPVSPLARELQRLEALHP